MASAPSSLEQRRQIGAAILELVSARGYAATSEDDIAAEAGVQRAGFDRLFAGKEDCFLQFYDEFTADFNRATFGAYEGEGTWRQRLRAAAWAAANWMADHPREVRYGTIEMLAVGEAAQPRREATLKRCVQMIDDGRLELDDPDSVSRSVAEGALGAIAETLMKNLSRSAPAQAEELVPELLYLAVRPYVGHDSALEELSIGRPAREP